ncbi:type II secretion system F family protein [Methylobacter sp. Wu8]|uniref:MSHA biogenesis protein MshG n=1 Tax=Methylobacter tundripaludum TaxID=173365 RepID=A0A2S6GSM1_9GAMM|nr:type II secretion system F family protein [Methylobacter tundripaludum]MCF7965308.1 type II secretion system F family protein [Methylobacter tundripaludum]MCK9635367.1 type II secretion system F family protein [Methylobacter tundripaludum]PPK68199.1 MSHA biogenesis protein MshG [Methylobacter tundripaludum]
MPFFSYKGRNNKGELVKGVLEGPDRSAIAKQVFNLGITPVEILPGSAPSPESNLSINLFQESIELVDVMMFCRQMYTLLKAGIPIMSALNVQLTSIRNKAFVEVISEVRASLDSGHELSAALNQHPKVFNSFYISMIRVGETTGMLDRVFLRLVDYLEFEKFMREQIKAALRYPTFVMAAMVVAIVVINLFVIPAFAKVFANMGAALPLMTRVLLGFSDFMVTSWPYLLVGIVVAGLLFRAHVTSINGKYQWDSFKLKIPIAGAIIHKASMARFARTFALSSKSGVPIMSTLTLVAQTVDNDFIAHKVEQMRQGVERGETILRTATNAGIFNSLVLQMIAVGEESGALDDLMEEIADMYQRDVEYEIKTLGARVEPIMIIFLGVLVLILALGIFLPIWDLGRASLHKT